MIEIRAALAPPNKEQSKIQNYTKICSARQALVQVQTPHNFQSFALVFFFAFSWHENPFSDKYAMQFHMTAKQGNRGFHKAYMEALLSHFLLVYNCQLSARLGSRRARPSASPPPGSPLRCTLFCCIFYTFWTS
jgi:hypothetical protein